MIRPIITAFVIFATLGLGPAWAQQAVSFKNFTSFRQIVPEVDFFGSNRQVIAPYEKPVSETVSRLKTLFGTNIPKGAIFVCSTLAQKDSIYEPMVLKRGFSWTLTVITPQVRMQEMMARMKSQMGGNLPAEIMDRLKSRLPTMEAEAEKQMVTTTTQQIAYAVLQTMLDKELKYRSSRLDDMGKSPLPDWLDIGIGAYASGAPLDLSYLQQHMDQTFPMEDIVAMSRPFVASSSDQGGGNRAGGASRGGGEGAGQDGGGFSRMGGAGGGGQGGPSFGQGMPQGGFSGRGMGNGNFQGGGGFPGGGFPGGGMNGASGRGGRNGRNLSKDEQDRMLFDGQASTFFAFLVEKVGIEKVKQLVKLAVEGKESRDFITRADVLGSDFSQIEEDWTKWVKDLKDPQTQRQAFQGQF